MIIFGLENNRLCDIDHLAFNVFKITNPQQIEHEVWEEAKKCLKIPHFGNLYTEILFDKFRSFLLTEYADLDLDIEYWVNGEASSFFINYEECRNKAEFWEIIHRAKTEEKPSKPEPDKKLNYYMLIPC